MRASPSLMVVAGEASGDLYGGLLVRALRERAPAMRFAGIGGSHMAAEGVRLLADSRELAVVGLVEVFSHLGAIRKAFRRAAAFLREERPDLLVLIDYPDFNLRLAREARRSGVPVLYFVSPQVWAWRASRVRQIAKRVDRMLVIFPFEEEIYREAGVPVEFVGHPLLDLMPAATERSRARVRLGLDPGRPVVGFLPGSRKREIRFHLPTMLESGRLLLHRHPRLQFVLPLASTLRRADLEEFLAEKSAKALGVRVLEGAPGEVLSALDVAVVKSGTATLEAALMGVPMAVVYRTTHVTYLLARLLTRVRHVGLVNIVAGREIVPELVQGDFTPGRVADVLDAFLREPDRAAGVSREMAALRERLGQPGCFVRAADAALKMLGLIPSAEPARGA